MDNGDTHIPSTLLVLGVAGGHVTCFGGDAGAVSARVNGYTLAAEVQLDQALAGMQFKPFTHVLVGHRVLTYGCPCLFL